MATSPPTLLRHLRRLAGPAAPDAALLDRFLRDRDEPAFAELVQRHGPMVFRVCRRVLRDAHDAEDAFQATFLVLARRAKAIRSRASLAAWLHGVARRVALKARAAQARRHRHEMLGSATAPPDPRPHPLAEVTVREALLLLDEEVARLPEAHRLPVILCCLEGLTLDEVAGRLGCTRGSVRGRLERGRKRLQRRLAKRGLTLAVALALAEVSRGAGAAGAPEGLVATTVSAALAFAAGDRAGMARLRAPVMTLAEGALPGLLSARAAVGAAVLLALALATAGVARWPGPSRPPGVAGAAGQPSEATAKHKGPALPPGAVARLGTLNFRQGGWLRAIALSPDGRLLAGVGGNNEVRVWDAAGGAERGCWPAPDAGGSPRAVAFAPGGRTLAVGGEAAVALLDAASGKPRRRLATAQVTAVAFAPDGKAVAAARLGGGVDLWDAATGDRLAALRAGDRPGEAAGRTWSVAYSPDGRLLAWGEGAQVAVWDVRSGKKLGLAIRHGAAAHAVAFSPDGKVLATSGEDRVVRLWDTATGKPVGKAEGHAVVVKGLAFSPDGKLLASASGDPLDGTGRELRALRLWDAVTGKEVAALGRHAEGVPSVRFSPDGKVLYAGGNMSVRRWDLAARRELLAGAGHQGWVGAAAFSPDGKALATGGSDMVVRLWDLRTRKELRALSGPEGAIDAVAYAPDGSKVASGSRDGRVLVWDAGTGREIARLQAGGPGWEAHVAFSPDGKLLASGSRDGHIVLWDAATGREVRRFPRSEAGVKCLAFSPDGRWLAAGYINDRKELAHDLVRLWDAASGREARRFAGARVLMVKSVAFSPDGRLLAAGDWGGAIHLWDTGTGALVRQLRGHRSGASGVAFSPDGRMVASTGYDGTVRLWEALTGAERRQFRGHLGHPEAPAFSPDGRTLATGAMDTTVLLWDVRAPVAGAPAAGGGLRPDQLERLWEALGAPEGAGAYAAIVRLAAAPGSAAGLLRGQLRPAARDDRETQKLLAALDSDDFGERERATAALAGMGDLAEPALRKAAGSKLSAEAKRRVEGLLQKLRTQTPSAEALRQLRAVEALEYMGTEGARRVLRELAEGAPEARLTREAKAALARLGK
jgi:RNA polymerase sigma factor (sigma-70 family)